MSKVELDNIFTYHSPTGEQTTRYQALRELAKAFAAGVQAMTPQSREQSVALTNIQQATMWANAAIAINEAGRV